MNDKCKECEHYDDGVFQMPCYECKNYYADMFEKKVKHENDKRTSN